MDMPLLGFGTWNLSGDDCLDSVKRALEVGYRHIDTADGYKNHQQVAQAIKQSGIKREDLFITTKVPRILLGYDDVLTSCDRYLQELGISYIDL
jgi:diketogulonate reductase-like aldo/keto reductase